MLDRCVASSNRSVDVHMPIWNEFWLSSAVVGFNRVPTLAVAILRRRFATMTAAYFDDVATVDTIAAAPSGQHCTTTVLSKMGFPPATPKSFPPSVDRVFLGASCRLAFLLDDGTIRFEPKWDTTARIEIMTRDALYFDELYLVTAGSFVAYRIGLTRTRRAALVA